MYFWEQVLRGVTLLWSSSRILFHLLNYVNRCFWENTVIKKQLNVETEIFFFVLFLLCELTFSCCLIWGSASISADIEQSCRSESGFSFMTSYWNSSLVIERTDFLLLCNSGLSFFLLFTNDCFNKSMEELSLHQSKAIVSPQCKTCPYKQEDKS